MTNHLLCLRLAAVPLAVAAAWPAHAHTPDAKAAAVPDLNETVVTATRTEQPLTDVLADVTLLDRRAIDESGAVSVADLLARQPGTELVRNGGPGTATSVYLRGAETRFTAVYVDGVRIDSQATGGAPWEALALDQVERIEIVRGPAAAVYGSDAVAGVIQIFTRKAEQDRLTPHAGVTLGTRRTGKLEAGLSGKRGAVDYALNASRARSDGFDTRPGTNPDRDGYRQSAASARLGWQVSRAHRLEASGAHSDMKAQYDGFANRGNRPATWVDDVARNRLQTAGLSWQAQWTPHYSTRLSASQSRQSYETSPSPYYTRTTLRNYLLHNEWRQGPHLLTAALERREDKLLNDPIARSRHQNALALGYGLRLGAHTLQVNLRRDDDSEFGGHTTGSAAYGFSFARGWRVSAALGSAFRVPTLYHRYSQYGQAGLQPEKGRNMELGLHYAQPGLRAGLSVYRNNVRNLVSFGAAGPCASTFGCYENTGRARYEGVTLSGGARLGAVNLSGSLDWQNPRNLDTGKQLARRARRQLKLAADTQVAGWTLGAEWQASGMRYDDAANTRRLGGYGVVNLFARTSFARGWSAFARIDNVGDKTYQLAHGYATAGRTLQVGVKWSMP
ncbi:MAG: TonB-dependent receptor [Comamonadaceae bacterium]|nr:TonB-dependent receptor [Comamonadaceae bacterium]